MKKILKSCDYDRIEEEANNLIEDLGIKQFPMDCFTVAFLLAVEIRGCSEFAGNDREFIVSRFQDGFTIFKAGKYTIYYNDSLDRNRIKFTIWHEIAHIQLGHLEAGCMIPYGQMEEEANHFAAYVMAPLVFVHRLRLNSPQEISDTCGIGFECASNVYVHYIRAFRSTRIRNTILNGRIARLLTYVRKDGVA